MDNLTLINKTNKSDASSSMRGGSNIPPPPPGRGLNPAGKDMHEYDLLYQKDM